MEAPLFDGATPREGLPRVAARWQSAKSPHGENFHMEETPWEKSHTELQSAGDLAGLPDDRHDIPHVVAIANLVHLAAGGRWRPPWNPSWARALRLPSRLPDGPAVIHGHKATTRDHGMSKGIKESIKNCRFMAGIPRPISARPDTSTTTTSRIYSARSSASSHPTTSPITTTTCRPRSGKTSGVPNRVDYSETSRKAVVFLKHLKYHPTGTNCLPAQTRECDASILEMLGKNHSFPAGTAIATRKALPSGVYGSFFIARM